MNCINCGNTMTKAAQVVFGFGLCQDCVDIGNLQEQLLTQGLDVEYEDPKTKNIYTVTYKTKS